MSSIIPDIFIILSAAAFLLALVAFWQSLRALFSQDIWSVSVGAPGDYSDRAAVLLERQGVQQTIEDIRSERDMGKLCQSDFDALSRALRDREREILRLVETDERSTREQARKLIEEHLMRRFDRDEPRSVDRAEESITCGGCGASNDLDARYCKRCGSKLDVEVEA